jgi:hypothetical protein
MRNDAQAALIWPPLESLTAAIHETHRAKRRGDVIV